MKKEKFVIGIDGGGTKSKIALANLKGEILKIEKGGPLHPTNLSVKKTAKNLEKEIKKILPKKGEILSIVVGLPAVQERKNLIEKIENEIKLSPKIKEKITILSDQLIALRSKAPKNEGIVLISGTGAVCHGWRGKKEVHISGWGYLADEGSAFWIGQRVLQFVLKSEDGRVKSTILRDILFEELKIKNIEELLNFVYCENFVKRVSQFSIFCAKACQKNDKIAKKIMKEAAKELSLCAILAIKKLEFQNEKFPLVLAGSVFNCQYLLNILKRKIKRLAPKVDFIFSKNPVEGAVKIALEKAKKWKF